MSLHLMPETRRLIIFALGSVAISAIVAEVVLLLYGATTSEALLNIAAVAVGGIAGLAVPSGGSDKE